MFRPDLPDPEAPVRQADDRFHPRVPSPNPVCDPRRLLSPHADAQVRGPQHQHHKPLLRAGGPIFRSSASRRHSRSSGCPEAGRSRRARDDRRSFTSARGRSARVGRDGPAGCRSRTPHGLRDAGRGSDSRRRRGTEAAGEGCSLALPSDSMPFRQVAEDPGFRELRRRPPAERATRDASCLFDRDALADVRPIESSGPDPSLRSGSFCTIELTLRRFGLAV